MENLLTTKQLLALRELIRRLTENNIDFVVIGGLAAIAWGVKRPLADIDIQVGRIHFKKVEILFANELRVDARRYETEKWDIHQMIIELHGIAIDICQAEDFYVKKDDRKYLVPNSLGVAMIKTVEDVPLPVLSLGQLAWYKQLIARPVDIEDLSSLAQLH